MYYNRSQMKELAKQRLKQVDAALIRKVTLVYLLLTTLLQSLFAVFYSSSIQISVEDLTAAIESGNDAEILKIYSQFFSGPGSMIAIFCTIFFALYVVVMGAGYYRFCMKIARNQPDAQMGDLSSGLEILPKLILLAVLMYIFVMLWSFLFVIPGIVAAYRYSMAFYCLVDDPSISAMEAIRRSKQLMHGQKGNKFVLDLSFLGWSLVAYVLSAVGEYVGFALGSLTGLEVVANLLSVLLSFGLYLIIGIWLTGYMQVADIYFYNYVRNFSLNPGPQGGPGGGFRNDNFGSYRNGGNSGEYNNYNYGGGDDWQSQPPENDQNQTPWN